MKKEPSIVIECNNRAKRREAVKRILCYMREIREAEQNYLDKVPENFQNSDSFEVGECAVETLGEIIGMLDDIY